MTATGTLDGPSAQKADYQSSDQYDPAKAEPAVAALLSPSRASAFNDPSVDTSHHNTSLPSTAPQNTHISSAATAVLTSTDRQSHSRSMTPDSSSANSSDQEIITEQNITTMSSNGVNGSSAPVSNGASVHKSTSPSKVQVLADPPTTVSQDNTVQGSNPSKTIASPYLETVAEFAVATPTKNNADTTNADSEPSSHPALGPTNAALPKPRLPHDRIGMLEDRIKDDPRGDIDAWLGLIDEHKKRAKLDDARSTYERFLAVFPFAVCTTRVFDYSMLADRLIRPKCGYPMRKWRMKPTIGML